MSFKLEFTAASAADAQAIVAQETGLPPQVSAFLTQALGAYLTPNAPATAVYVKAEGHLFDNDNVESNAQIDVRRVAMRAPTATPARARTTGPAPASATGPMPTTTTGAADAARRTTPASADAN